MKNKAIEKNPGGQPEKFRPEFVELAYKFCLLGATDSQLAEMFEVKELTINNWKKRHSDFTKAVRVGKMIADANIANSLYEQAVGFTRKVKKIVIVMGQPETVEYEEYFPPSTTAAIFWLKNRDKKNWRDKHDIEHSVSPLQDFLKQIDGVANKLPDSREER